MKNLASINTYSLLFLLLFLGSSFNSAFAQTAIFIGDIPDGNHNKEIIIYDLQNHNIRYTISLPDNVYGLHGAKFNSTKDKLYILCKSFDSGPQFHILEYATLDPSNITLTNSIPVPTTNRNVSIVQNEFFFNSTETKIHCFVLSNDFKELKGIEIDITNGNSSTYNVKSIVPGKNIYSRCKFVQSRSQNKIFFIGYAPNKQTTHEGFIEVIDYSTTTPQLADPIPYKSLVRTAIPGLDANSQTPINIAIDSDGNKLYVANGQINKSEGSAWMTVIDIVGKTASADYAIDGKIKIGDGTNFTKYNDDILSLSNGLVRTDFRISPDKTKALLSAEVNEKRTNNLSLIQLDANSLPTGINNFEVSGQKSEYIGFHPTNNNLAYIGADGRIFELDLNTKTFNEEVSEWITFSTGATQFKAYIFPSPKSILNFNFPEIPRPTFQDRLFVLTKPRGPLASPLHTSSHPSSSSKLKEINAPSGEIHQQITFPFGTLGKDKAIYSPQRGSLFFGNFKEHKIFEVDLNDFRIKQTLTLPIAFKNGFDIIGVNGVQNALFLKKPYTDEVFRVSLNSNNPVPEKIQFSSRVSIPIMNLNGNKLFFPQSASVGRDIVYNVVIYDLNDHSFSAVNPGSPTKITYEREAVPEWQRHVLTDYYGNLIFILGGDNKIRAYSTLDGSLVRGPFDIGPNSQAPNVSNIILSTDEQKLYFLRGDNKIITIDADLTQVLSEDEIGNLNLYFVPRGQGQQNIRKADGFHLSPSSDRDYIYLYRSKGNLPNFIAVVDLNTKQVVRTISANGEVANITHPIYPPGQTPPAPATAYITSNGHDDISVIDVGSNKEIAVIQLESGANPYGVAVSPDGRRAYAGNRGNNTVSVIQTATNRKIHTISISAKPLALAVSPDGSELFVTTLDGAGVGKVEVYKREDYSLARTITVGNNPDGIALAPDGTAYLTNRIATGFAVSKIAAGASVLSGDLLIGNSAEGIAITSDGQRAYAANVKPGAGTGQVTAIDLSTFTVAGNIDVQAKPEGIAVSPDDSKVYVANRDANSVSIVDATDLTATAVHVTVGTNPEGVSVSPDGSKVYIVNEGSDNISILNTSDNSISGTIPVGDKPEGFGQFIAPAVYSDLVLDLDPHAYVSNSDDDNVSVINTRTNMRVKTIPVGDYPEGVAVHPNGSKVYITNLNSDNLSVIEQSSGIVEATITTGQKPLGICLNADGSKAYVANVGLPGGTSPSYTATASTVSVINTTDYTTSTIAGVNNPYGLALKESADRLYATNYYSGTVTEINTSSNTVLGTINVGLEPCGILYHKGLDKLYVANHKSNTVSVIDLSTATPTVTSITVGAEPIGLAFSNEGDLLYVTHENLANVEIIETATDTKSSNTLAATTFQRGISLTPGGKWVYVIDSDDHQVRVFDAETRAEHTNVPVGNNPEAFGKFITAGKTKGFIPIVPTNTTTDRTGTIAVADLDQPFAEALVLVEDAPSVVQVSPDGERAYIADNTGTDYQVIHALTNRSSNYELDYIPSDLELSGDGNLLFISEKVNPNLNVLDAYSGNSLETHSTGTNALSGITSSPDGNTLCGASTTGELVIIQRDPYQANNISTLGGTIGETVFHPDGSKIFVQVAGVGIKVVDLAGAAQGSISGINVAVFTLSPDGNTLYFTEASDNKLYKVDVSGSLTLDIAATPSLKQTVARVGNNTKCLEVSPDGKYIYVLDANEDDLMAFDANLLNQTTALKTVQLKGKPSGCGCFMRFPE